MSIRDALRAKLVESGLGDGQADAVMLLLEVHDTSETMTSRWNDQVEDYPPLLMDVLWRSTRQEALDWIDANKPQHWARPMFLEEA